MRKKNNNKLVLILLLLICISLGFAALTTTLQINGLTKIKGNTWDIYFENVVVKDGSVEADTPVISDMTTVDFEVELEKPRDFYEFDVDVKNNGTIDAMIDSINKTNLTSEQSVYLDYVVTGINEKALLKASSKKTVTVRVEFKDITADKLPSVTEPITLNLSFDCVQADESAVKEDSVVKLVYDENNDGVADVGDKFCVSTECFYVISNKDGEVRALAEWNLYVGNETNIDFDGKTFVTQLANPTGLQDSSARGWHYAEGTTTTDYPSIGVVAFSSYNYWYGINETTVDLSNGANLINYYLINYKNKISEIGLNLNDVTLITKNELENLGCSSFDDSCQYAPSWVYQTSFWTRSAYYANVVWHVSCNGYFDSSTCDSEKGYGVRPVIVFDESLLG